MLTEEEIKEIETLKKDPDVKLAKKYYNKKEKQRLYQLRSLKKRGQRIRESLQQLQQL